MKKYLVFLLTIALLLVPSTVFGQTIFPNRGGTGTTTFTGIPVGNGISPFTPLVIGSGLDLTTGTLSSVAGGSDTQVQFNDAGAFGANSGFTFDKILKSLRIAYESSGGFVQNTGNGSLSLGYTIDDGEISTSSDGTFSFGYVADSDSYIRSQGNGSWAGGFAVGGGHIGSTNGGTVAFGRIDGLGEIISSGEGSYAGGSTDGVSLIESSNEGSYAFGQADNGNIRATEGGSFANGFSNNAVIEASSKGAMARGYAEGSGGTTTIEASGEGSTAFGRVSDGFSILASGGGSFAGGLTNGSIISSGDGSFAWGSDVTASADFATVFGTKITNATTNSFAIGYGGETNFNVIGSGDIILNPYVAVQIPYLTSSSVVFTDASSKLTSTGIIPVNQGGTGVGTITGLIKGNGTSPFTAAVAGTDYQLPYWTLTSGQLTPTTTTNKIGIGKATATYWLDVLDSTTGMTASSRTINASFTGGTYNTTAGALSSYGGYFNSNATRSAGANALTNVGLYASASGAQNNYAAIFENGSVGIGTTDPTSPLHILSTTPNINIDRASGTNSPLVQFGFAGTQQGIVGIAGTTNVLVAGSVAGDMAFRTVSKNMLWSNDNGTTAHMYLSSRGSLGIGDSTPATNAKRFSIIAGTLADGISGIKYTATMPTTLTTNNYASNYQITSAGSSSQISGAMNVEYLAGYTGSSRTLAGRFINAAAGTGTTYVAGLTANAAVQLAASATTTGTNIGSFAQAVGGNVNIGSVASSIFTKNSATAVGVAGFALNSGTSPINVGGFFGLMNTEPTYASAALMADNGGTTSDIFVARDNGTATFTIADGGNVTSTGKIIMSGASSTIRLKSYTVSTLPTGTEGDTAYVTDAVLPTFLGVLTGGGSVKTPVFYNGSAWVSY